MPSLLRRLASSLMPMQLAKRWGFLPRSAGRPLLFTIPVMPYSPRRGTREILQAYRNIGIFQAVVDTVAEAVAMPSWHVYKPVTAAAEKRWRSIQKSVVDPRERREERKKALEDGELIEVAGHELEELLLTPTPTAPGREMLKLLQVYIDLCGEAFMLLRRENGTGRAVGYELVPPHFVAWTPTPDRPTFFINYKMLNGEFSERDVIWLKELDPEDPLGRGIGRGLALGDELDTSEAIQRGRKATFERGGLPAATVGVESTEGDAEQDAKRLEKKYLEEFTGPENAAKVLFVSGKVSLAAVQQDFRALQMDEVEKGIRSYIRQCFNVSPELVGDLTSSNRSTADAAKYILAEHASLPRLEFIRSWWQLKLVPQVDREAILDYDDPRPQEFERVLKVMTAAPNEGFTWDEVRALAGYKPDSELAGKRPRPLPGAQPVQDSTGEPQNPPPPRGPAQS